MANDPGKPNRVNKTTFATKYPYNRVMVTESGHEVHYDDSPGAERIRVSHKDGSYWELSPGGKKVEYTVGHSQAYNKGGVTMTVDENNDVKVHGHQRQLTGGGIHTETAGETSSVGGGDKNIVHGGAMRIAIAGFAYVGINQNCNININGDMNMKVSGTTTMESGGDFIVKAANIRLN